MKKKILLFLMSLSFFMAADAQTNESCTEKSFCAVGKNFYAMISGGANFLQNTSLEGNKTSYQTGYIAAVSLGYCWRYGLSLEGEFAFRKNAIKKIQFFGEGSSKHGYFQTSSYMANILWDLPLSPRWCGLCCIHPFIGAGIGYDSQHMHSSNSRIIFNQYWNHFAWQIMVGLAYPVFRNTEMTLEYKFHQGGCHFYNHTIGVGLAYKFNFSR